MAGLHAPSAGEVSLDGNALARRLADRDPRDVQIVFQDPYSALNPRLTIGDALREALAVGDRPASDVAELLESVGLSVQAQILALLLRLRDELGTPVLVITHDLAVVRQVCDRVLVLRRGEMVESGTVSRVFDAPEHPYTASLLAAREITAERKEPTRA